MVRLIWHFPDLQHYENMPMQDTENFFSCKNREFCWKNIDKFYIYVFGQNIDCVYTLEPPRRGSPNEYPKSMFWIKYKKNSIPPYTPLLQYKSGV